MKVHLVAALGVACLGFAQGLREVGFDDKTNQIREVPYAPSPGATPYVSLGYRELTADLLYARLRTYAGGYQPQAEPVAKLVEAIAAVDPRFKRVYDWGSRAMRVAQGGTEQKIAARAAAVLEHGIEAYPDDWQILKAASEVYLYDLETEDPDQRRRWDERGAMLLDSALRKPGAPAGSGVAAAILRSRLGQHQRAIQDLIELILVTEDTPERDRLLTKLAELQGKSDRDALAAEVLEMRSQFERAWRGTRPALPASLYVLLGAPAGDSFDMADLALGGIPLVEPPPPPLPPITD